MNARGLLKDVSLCFTRLAVYKEEDIINKKKGERLVSSGDSKAVRAAATKAIVCIKSRGKKDSDLLDK